MKCCIALFARTEPPPHPQSEFQKDTQVLAWKKGGPFSPDSGFGWESHSDTAKQGRWRWEDKCRYLVGFG